MNKSKFMTKQNSKSLDFFWTPDRINNKLPIAIAFGEIIYPWLCRWLCLDHHGMLDLVGIIYVLISGLDWAKRASYFTANTLIFHQFCHALKSVSRSGKNHQLILDWWTKSPQNKGSTISISIWAGSMDYITTISRQRSDGWIANLTWLGGQRLLFVKD